MTGSTRSLEGSRLVITGGAGFIGHHSVSAAHAAGAALLVIDDLRHAAPTALPDGVELLAEELSTQAAHDAIVSFKPDAILHLAAQGGVIRSFRDPVADARANIVATLAVITAARDAGTKRIVFSSSGGALYGKAEKLPSDEDTRCAPLSPYGLAKWSCEQYFRLFESRGEIEACCLRYGNVYGPLQDGTGEAGVVAITSRRLLEKRSPEIFGDGLQTRDFVFVGDIADANMRALASDVAGSYNVGTGRATTVKEVVETLVDISGTGIAIEERPYRTGEVKESLLDPARIATALGWRSRMPIREGLSVTFSSFTDMYGDPNRTPETVRKPVPTPG